MNDIVLLNPLPAALDHYEESLASVLTACGATVRRPGWPVAEVRGKGRAPAALRHLVRKSRLRDGPYHLLLWPTLGWLDVLRSSKARVGVVMHDPQPLRPQPFLGPRPAAFVRKWPASARADIIVHSELARSVVADLGHQAGHVLPLPLHRGAQRTPGTESRPRVVRVLGSYKPTRDLGLLASLPRQLPNWTFEVLGRGWPPVGGWKITDRFLSEEALQAAIASAGIVLIPYLRYFQSDIAVRALEQGVPVAGQEGSYIAEILGADYPGLARDESDWADAVERAYRQRDILHVRIAALRHRVQVDWAEWVNVVGRQNG